MLAHARGMRAPGRGRCCPSAAAGPAIQGEVAVRSRASGWCAALILRTLALLTTFGGAKLGANAHRHQATSGDVQRFSLRPEPTSGDIGRCQATLGEWLLVRDWSQPSARQHPAEPGPGTWCSGCGREGDLVAEGFELAMSRWVSFAGSVRVV